MWIKKLKGNKQQIWFKLSQTALIIFEGWLLICTIFLNFFSVLNLYFKVKNVNRKTEFLLLKISVHTSVILCPGKKDTVVSVLQLYLLFLTEGFVLDKVVFPKAKIFVGFLCISKDCFKQGFSWSVWLANCWSPELRVMKAVEWLHGLHTEGYFQISLRPSGFHAIDTYVGYISKCSQHGFVELNRQT